MISYERINFNIYSVNLSDLLTLDLLHRINPIIIGAGLLPGGGWGGFSPPSFWQNS
jgi:hypothetical protein